MQGSTGSLGHPGSCKVLHAATRVRIVGGPAQIRGAGHCPLEIGRNTKGRRRHREILSSFFMKIDAAQSAGRVSSFSRSLGRLGNTLAFLGRCETQPKGTFVGDVTVRVSNPVPDSSRYKAVYLGLPRPPLLCRRWLRYPWIDCVDSRQDGEVFVPKPGLAMVPVIP